MKTSTKFIIASLFIILLPMAFLAALSNSITNKRVEKSVHEAINIHLKAAWLQYYERANQMNMGLLQAANTHGFAEAVKKRDKEYLRNQGMLWKKYRPYLDIWTVVDAESRVIARINSNNAGDMYDINGLIEKAVGTRMPVVSTEIVSKEFLLKEDKRLAEQAHIKAVKGVEKDEYNRKNMDEESGMMTIVAVPIIDKSDRVIGAIVAGDLLNNDSYFSDALEERFPGLMATIAHDGMRISTNIKEGEGIRAVGTLLPQKVMDSINMWREYTGKTYLLDKEYFTAFHPIKNNKGEVIGSIFVGLPEKAFTEIRRENLRSISIAAIFGSAVALVIILIITQRITKPLKLLASGIKEIEKGNLDVCIPVADKGKTEDELTRLTLAFNDMVKALKIQIEETSLLLKSIEEKNRELLQTNRALQSSKEQLEVAYEEAQTQSEELESANEELRILNEDLDKKTKELLDVNKRLKTEEETASLTRNELQSIFDGIQDNIIFFDLDYNIIKANTAFFNKFPFDKKDLSTKKCYQLLQKRDTPCEVCAVRDTYNTKTTNFREERGTSEKIIQKFAFPVKNSSGILTGVVEHIKDVTDQRMIEQQLIQAEKLTSLGEMLSGVAHELNNPLTGIIGFSELILEKEPLPDIKNSISKINKEALRCKKIVQNLLTFARRHAPEREYININDIIHMALELREYDLNVNNIKVVTSLDLNLPMTMADSFQIQQVFLNIINNAQHAMIEHEGKGMLTISTSFKNDIITIRLSDTGPGIAPENLSRIFDPFFTTKGVGKGTGLGLSISYGIIKEHGGRISVASKLEEGAAFTIELPVIQAEAAVSEDAAVKDEEKEEKKITKKSNIIVVDDEPVILELIKEILSKEGHHVDTAANGKAALKLIKEKTYDLLISDVKMPDMSGIELLSKIKRSDPELAKRVIMATGDSVGEDIVKKGIGYLPKPFTVDKLKKAVAKALGKKR
ncbi:MAG: ATP-binding protein [Nitrospirota bacterium]|mgnify:CR=1 FL=1